MGRDGESKILFPCIVLYPLKSAKALAIKSIGGEDMDGSSFCKSGVRLMLCFSKAIPHNSKCRYGERGAADAKPKAQIILDAAKVSAASGGNSEPKQGQRSQSARGFCPRSTMRVPQPDIIEHFGNADAVPQLPERCLSRKAGIVRCCPKYSCTICSIKARSVRWKDLVPAFS